MGKTGWQSVAVLTLSLLIVTNAAHFYTRRVMASEHASMRPKKLVCPGRSSVVDEIPTYAPVRAVAADPTIKCFSGVPMKSINGTWEQMPGTC